MPLSYTNFVTNGHLIHQDVQQFADLLTGVMTDQPVTISNTLKTTGVATLGSDVIVAGAIKYGTAGTSTTTIYSPSAGQIAVTAALQITNGGLTFSPDNSYDIGASGTGRPRNLFLASTLTVPQATVTGLLSAGNLNFPNAGSRITADMSSSPTANRLTFQTNVANGITAITAIPNGTATTSALILANNANPDAAGELQLIAGATNIIITSTHTGTGANLPLILGIAGSQVMTIGANNMVSFNDTTTYASNLMRIRALGNTSSTYALQVVDSTNTVNIFYTRDDGYCYMQGPLNVATINASTITFPNGQSISYYTGGSDTRISMNALTVTPGPTSLASLSCNGPATINGNLSMNGSILFSASQYINLDNGNIQYCATLYGQNNSGYITNDGSANWTIANALTVGSTLQVNGQITMLGAQFTFQNSSYGIITVTPGANLYLRPGPGGGVIIDAGAGLLTVNSVTCAGIVTANNNFTSNGATWRSDGNVSIACLANQTGVHYFMTNGQSTWAPVDALNFNTMSARKFKTDICVLEDPLDIVLDERVHAVRYTDIARDEPNVGFVAEDWVGVLPEVIALDEMGDILALDYNRISAVTFEALKQYAIKTDARLRALEARLAA